MKRLTTAMLLLSSAVVNAQSAPDFAPPVTYESIPVTLINPLMYWGAAGDFNGDGRMDLVSVDLFTNNVVGYSNINGFSIALATPTGFAVPISKSIGLRLMAVQSADFNHDGFADLVVEGPAGAAVLLADGTGDFGAPVSLGLSITPTFGAIADFNTDGNPDLVFTSTTGQAVALGTATGAFQPATLLSSLTPSYNVLTGDLNSDGKIDFSTMAGSYLGNGDGTFTNVGGGIGVNSQLGDFDRDGTLDMASIWTQSVGQESSYFYLSIARGLGNGQFQQYFDWQFQGGIVGLLVDDFNKDGNPDVATYDFAAGMLRVAAGNGTLVLGGFLDSVPLPSHAGGIIAADMDGNGSNDIVYSNYRTYSVLRSTHGNPPLLSQLSLSPASVVGGSAVSATLSLGGVAPAGGIQVALSSSDPNAFFTAGPTVTIPAGASSAAVQVTTTAVSAATFANLSASANGVTQTTRLDLVAPYTLTGFSINPASQYGIFNVTGTVSLSGPASADAVVALSSGNPAVATVPASVTIPAGANSGTFTITLKPVAADTATPISVSLGGLTQNASLTVLKPADTVKISKAIWSTKTARLDVDATSTSATATIGAYNSVTGVLMGTLTNAGGGKYKGSFIAFPTGGTITLKSTLGGTVTGAYQSKI